MVKTAEGITELEELTRKSNLAMNVQSVTLTEPSREGHGLQWPRNFLNNERALVTVFKLRTKPQRAHS